MAVYARPPDPARPLVCFDEAGKDLKAHTRPPQPAAPGRDARKDSHYARAGSRNLFLACAPHLGWRQILVTEHRTAVDFAYAVRALVDQTFPTAARIVLVLDNLNTHQYPPPGIALSGLPPGRSLASPGAPGVALHPHPWPLAEHGRGGVVGAGSPVPAPAHPRSDDAGD